MKPVVLSVIGRKGAGRSQALAGLIEILTRRGFNTGVIKHMAREDFEVDLPGKDTFEYRARGAEKVILSGPKRMAIFANLQKEVPVFELVNEFQGYDLVLVEGYFANELPKIEFHRRDAGHPLAVSVQNLAALCSDYPDDLTAQFNVPCFSLEKLEPLADWLELFYLSSPNVFVGDPI